MGVWGVGASHRHCPDAFLIGRVEVGKALTCHVPRLPRHLASTQEHGPVEHRGWGLWSDTLSLGGRHWGSLAKGCSTALGWKKLQETKFRKDLETGEGEPLNCPSNPTHPNRNSRNPPQGAPLPFSPSRPAWQSGDRRRLTTSRCGHSHEAGRGGG